MRKRNKTRRKRKFKGGIFYYLKKEVVHVVNFFGGEYMIIKKPYIIIHHLLPSLFIPFSLSFSLVLFTKESLITVMFETVKQTKKKVKKIVIQNNA